MVGLTLLSVSKEETGDLALNLRLDTGSTTVVIDEEWSEDHLFDTEGGLPCQDTRVFHHTPSRVLLVHLVSITVLLSTFGLTWRHGYCHGCSIRSADFGFLPPSRLWLSANICLYFIQYLNKLVKTLYTCAKSRSRKKTAYRCSKFNVCCLLCCRDNSALIFVLPLQTHYDLASRSVLSKRAWTDMLCIKSTVMPSLSAIA